MRLVCRYHVPDVKAICPIDRNTTDHYEVVVESSEMITVEGLLRDIDKVTAEPIYQEQMTEQLAEVLEAEVRSVGTHSGVRTICTATWGDDE